MSTIFFGTACCSGRSLGLCGRSSDRAWSIEMEAGTVGAHGCQRCYVSNKNIVELGMIRFAWTCFVLHMQ